MLEYVTQKQKEEMIPVEIDLLQEYDQVLGDINNIIRNNIDQEIESKFDKFEKSIINFVSEKKEEEDAFIINQEEILLESLELLGLYANNNNNNINVDPTNIPPPESVPKPVSRQEYGYPRSYSKDPRRSRGSRGWR